MQTRIANLNDSLVIVREDDRAWGFLVHALGWIPIWGFIFNATCWLYFKNRSREMVFHIQQAIQFHIVVLMPLLAWIFITVLTRLLHQLNADIAEVAQTTNSFFLSTALTVCGATAAIGGALVYSGRGFLYPVIGRRVLEGTIRKYTEG